MKIYYPYFILLFNLLYFILHTHQALKIQKNSIWKLQMSTSNNLQEICITSQIRSLESYNSQVNPTQFEIIKTLKLPVWPVVGGLLVTLAHSLGNKKLSSQMLDSFGGRVVPMQFSDQSPFLLLAHHVHSFTPFDPFRKITEFLLPEGFPAHPHAGFDTVTYCIEGGLRHRDSEGIKMSYGNGDCQWMRAGRAVLHEEMWDVDPNKFTKIEIFQLWVNLPQQFKESYPEVKVISRESIPSVNIDKLSKTFCKVISGTLKTDTGLVNGPGNEISRSNVNIFHLIMEDAGSLVSLTIPNEFDYSCMIYVRRGSLLLEKECIGHGDYVQILSNTAQLQSGENGLDCLILIGEKLQEPVVAGGPFIQTSTEKLRLKYEAFNIPGLDYYWDYKLPDREWKKFIERLALQRRI